MIAQELLNPKSIVVIGASSDTQKPGGSVLRNLINSNFKGEIYTVNPKETEVQGIKCFQKVDDLPQVDCAIIAIAAKYCPATVNTLAFEKGTNENASNKQKLKKKNQNKQNQSGKQGFGFLPAVEQRRCRCAESEDLNFNGAVLPPALDLQPPGTQDR